MQLTPRVIDTRPKTRCEDGRILKLQVMGPLRVSWGDHNVGSDVTITYEIPISLRPLPLRIARERVLVAEKLHFFG